jgi:hypothetical protein
VTVCAVFAVSIPLTGAALLGMSAGAYLFARGFLLLARQPNLVRDDTPMTRLVENDGTHSPITKERSFVMPGSAIQAGADRALFTDQVRGSGVRDFAATDGKSDEREVAAPKVIRLSSSGSPLTASEMTQQGKIAAALVKAGIQQPEAWETVGVSTEAPGNQPAAKAAQVLMNGTRDRGRDNPGATQFVLRQDEHDCTFLSSVYGQQDLRSISWKSLAMLWGGGGLMLLGAYVLLLQMGML